MLKSLAAQLVEDLCKHSKYKKFFTIEDLVVLGIFTSKQSVRIALRKGQIPYIRLSERRRLIPYKALENYILTHLCAIDHRPEKSLRRRPNVS